MKQLLVIAAVCGSINPAMAGNIKDSLRLLPNSEPANVSVRVAEKNYSVAQQNCPCKTPSGACRYGSDGKPATNC